MTRRGLSGIAAGLFVAATLHAQPVGAILLSDYPDLLVTLNGDIPQGLFPGLGRLNADGSVTELNRLTQAESGNSFSAFGITKNNRNEYWTSSANRLIGFDPSTGAVLTAFDRVDQAFLNLVFAPDDRLLGWSNGNGYLYEITLGTSSYSETQLVFVGLDAGGLTEMAFAPDGTLYGVDNRNKRIVTMDLLSGALNTVAQLPFGSYIGLAFASDGTFFFTDNISRALIQMDTSGTELGRIGLTTSTPVMGLEFVAVPAPDTLLVFCIGLAGLVVFRCSGSERAQI